jgi:putative phage-type endonuclease
MKIIDCEQNSSEWFQARLGIPTSSRFGDIITPKTLEVSKSSEKYMYELIAEWLTGSPKDGYISDAMANGFLLQPEATEYYELKTGRDVKPVGFCLEDGGRYGASPDGLPDGERTLEIKCPKQNTHAWNLVSGAMDTKYTPQVQGQLLVTELDRCDFLSYHPEMEGMIVEVVRNEPYIKRLSAALDEFCDRLAECKERLLKRGIAPKEVTP